MMTCRHHRPDASSYKLVLDVQDQDARCYYGSVWDQGSAVLLDHNATDGRRVSFQHRFPFLDGCWLRLRNGSAACVTYNAPNRLVSIWSRASASLSSSTIPNWP